MNNEPSNPIVEPTADPWKHRSETMKCKTCMWFLPKSSDEDNAYNMGRCRRHCPSISGFPILFDEDWCGDHEIDKNISLAQRRSGAKWKRNLFMNNPINL